MELEIKNFKCYSGKKTHKFRLGFPVPNEDLSQDGYTDSPVKSVGEGIEDDSSSPVGFTGGSLSLLCGESGSGKSTIFEAIKYTFYGSSNVRSLNASGKETKVSIVIPSRESTHERGRGVSTSEDAWKIVRKSYPSSLSVKRGEGEAWTGAAAQKVIENDILGMNIDQFMNSSYIVARRSNSIVSMRAADQATFIEKLVYGDEDDRFHPQNILNKLNSEMGNVSKEISTLHGSIKSLKETVKQLDKRVVGCENDTDSLSEKVDGDMDNDEIQALIHSKQKEIISLNVELERMNAARKVAYSYNVRMRSFMAELKGLKKEKRRDDKKTKIIDSILRDTPPSSRPSVPTRKGEGDEKGDILRQLSSEIRVVYDEFKDIYASIQSDEAMLHRNNLLLERCKEDAERASVDVVHMSKSGSGSDIDTESASEPGSESGDSGILEEVNDMYVWVGKAFIEIVNSVYYYFKTKKPKTVQFHDITEFSITSAKELKSKTRSSVVKKVDDLFSCDEWENGVRCMSNPLSSIISDFIPDEHLVTDGKGSDTESEDDEGDTTGMKSDITEKILRRVGVYDDVYRTHDTIFNSPLSSGLEGQDIIVKILNPEGEYSLTHDISLEITHVDTGDMVVYNIPATRTPVEDTDSGSDSDESSSPGSESRPEDEISDVDIYSSLLPKLKEISERCEEMFASLDSSSSGAIDTRKGIKKLSKTKYSPLEASARLVECLCPEYNEDDYSSNESGDASSSAPNSPRGEEDMSGDKREQESMYDYLLKEKESLEAKIEKEVDKCIKCKDRVISDLLHDNYSTLGKIYAAYLNTEASSEHENEVGYLKGGLPNGAVIMDAVQSILSSLAYRIESDSTHSTRMNNVESKINSLRGEGDEIGEWIDDEFVLQSGKDADTHADSLSQLEDEIKTLRVRMKIMARIDENKGKLDELKKIRDDNASQLEAARSLKKDKETRLEMISAIIEKCNASKMSSMNTILNVINHRASVHLNHFFPSHHGISIALRNEFTTKSGSKRNKMSVQIGYKGCVYDSFSDLSDGEQQRVELAYLLAVNEIVSSNILLLDECLNNIDPSTHVEVTEYLREYASAHGKTILVTSHEAVEGLFDEVIRFSL